MALIRILFALIVIISSTQVFAARKKKTIKPPMSKEQKILLCKCKFVEHQVRHNPESFKREYAYWLGVFGAPSGYINAEDPKQLIDSTIGTLIHPYQRHYQVNAETIREIVNTCYGNTITKRGLELRPYIGALWMAKYLEFSSVRRTCGQE